MTNTVLAIWIKGRLIPQGKIYKLNDKWVFLANVDDNKEWGKTGTLPKGYAIAAQVLEAFEKAKIRPKILYKHTTKGIVYLANRSVFQSKGILLPYGSHRQFLLPFKGWKFFTDDLQEPYQLPITDINKWVKGPNFDEQPKIDTSVMMRLKKEFNRKYRLTQGSRRV